MCHKFFKRMVFFVLSVFLVLSLPVLSFADTKGKMDPDDYLFLTVFRACGVSPGVDVGRWVGLYKGYLRSIGDEALLSQVEGYASLGWGDTAQGVDALFESVKGWLSLSDSYGTESAGYGLPSSPSRQIGEISSMDEVSVLSTPFSEVTYNESGYHYVFSQAFSVGSGTIRQNIYAPDGVEIIAVWSQVYNTSFDYYDGVSVELYMVDSSSATGYSSAPTKYKYSLLSADGTVKLFDTVIPLTSFCPNIASVMNCPFHVFNSVEDMETYCKTGVVNNTFNSNSCFVTGLGKDGGLDPELQKMGLASIGSQMTLPASRDDAVSSAAKFQKPLSRQELTAILSQNGINDVTYTAAYTVEHYIKNTAPDADEETWTLADTETFTGIAGTQAVYSAKDYPNYLIDYSLTKPSDCQILLDGSLVVRLYYKPDPDAVYPYTVEYYKDGECFETVSGTVPMFGDRMVRDYEDFCPKYYLLDRKASTPLPFEVSEENNTIRISYKRDVYATFSYTAEYYKDGELFKSLPGTVSVFNPYVKTCISYCPKGYVLDTTSSTALPFEVPETGGVVKNYYVKQDTVLPYTVEYYKDGLRMSTFSGNVPSASPLLQSFPSRCPEYYTPDQERSTPMPYTVPEGGGRIKVYYKKDEGAIFPYTVECYKDGEFVESVSKTVSVFDPAVKEYGFDFPEGYVVDTSSSTYLPYSVSKDSNVIRYYYVDEGKSLPYTVEYYKDGKEFSTLSGNVPVTSPVVNSYWPYCPEGYIRDGASSDSLPFTVTKDHNVIRAYYIPDPSNPYASFTGGVTRLVNFVIDFLGKAIFWLFILVVFYLFIDKNLVLVKRITSQAKSRDSKQKKKKKLFTAPKSRFMKGVHANRGTSLKSKAKMKHREKIYVRPDLRRPRGSNKQNGLGM